MVRPSYLGRIDLGLFCGGLYRTAGGYTGGNIFCDRYRCGLDGCGTIGISDDNGGGGVILPPYLSPLRTYRISLAEFFLSISLSLYPR